MSKQINQITIFYSDRSIDIKTNCENLIVVEKSEYERLKEFYEYVTKMVKEKIK